MTSILLITPQGVDLQGQKDGMRIAPLHDWPSAGELADAVCHSSEDVVAIGRVSQIDVEAVRRLVEPGAPDTLVMPLEGYEWVSTIGALPGHVLSLVPGIESGVLTAISDRRAREMAVSSTTADELIRSALRLGGRIKASAVGQPVVPFAPPRLHPGGRAANGSIVDEVRRFDPESVTAVASSPDAVALKAGLLLMHDLLDESHQLSQSIEGAGTRRTGDYWHAIMHRREPDYGNAKYWFRHVGRHPLFDELAGRADSVLHDVAGDQAGSWARRLGTPHTWNAMSFVDLCESDGSGEDTSLGLAARRIQWEEMLLLLRWTCADACGTSPH